jgi:hypothetical protein
MKTKVRFKLDAEQVPYVEAMANAVKLSVDELAKKSLLKTVQSLYEELAKVEEEQEKQRRKGVEHEQE